MGQQHKRDIISKNATIYTNVAFSMGLKFKIFFIQREGNTEGNVEKEKTLTLFQASETA